MRVSDFSSRITFTTGLSPSRRAPFTEVPRTANANTASLRETFRKISRFRDELRELRSSLTSPIRSQSTSAGTLPDLVSQSALGLNNTATATTLRTTEEVNTGRDYYGVDDPTFEGSSTADPTLTGVYTGVDDDTLTFTVVNGGVLGTRPLDIEVRDSAGNLTDSIHISVIEPENTPHTLSNGLTFRLSSGSAFEGDSFQVDVTANTPASANADNAFNGTGANGANLDPGESVVNGSFQVNGVSIAVFESDSVNSVLGKITSSSAGVTAEFDAVNEQVLLTSKTAGSAQTISITGDTSGFVQAVKLDTSTTTPGTDSDLDRAVDTVAPLAAIENGTLQVNGTDFTIDAATDTLNSLLADLNAAEVGIEASYESATDRVRLRSNPGTTSFTLSDGTTKFFETLGISTGTFEAQESSSRTVNPQARRRAANAVTDFTESLNGLLGDIDDGGTLAEIQSTVADILGDDKAIPGLELGGENGEFLSASTIEIANALTGDPAALRDLFLSKASGSDGLIDALDDALAERQRDLQLAIAEAGDRLVDVLA